MFLIVFLQATGSMSTVVMLVSFMVIFYFFMLRPQLSKQKKEKKFRAEIQKGMKVVTTGGVHGKITEISSVNNTVVIETGAGKIRFEKSAISMEMTNNINKN